MPSRGNTVEFEGLPEMRAHFKKHGEYLEVVGRNIAKAVADDIVIVAKDLVAYDTGRTQQNIKAEARGPLGARVIATRGGERDIVPLLLELGTYKMAPRPFMGTARDMAMAAGSLRKALREVGGLIKQR